MKRLAAPLVALSAGAVLTLAFAPFGIYPAAWLGIGVLFGLLRWCSPAAAAWRGYCFGFGKYAAGTSWVYVSIHEHGHAGVVLAAALTGLFVAGLALIPAAMALAWTMLLRTRRVFVDVLSFAAAWALFDWLMTWLLTGFPWLLAGYPFIDTPLAGWAPLVGVLGVGWLAALTAAALAALTLGAWRARSLRWSLTALAVLPLPIGAALSRTAWVAYGDSHRAALVQGNIDQEQKWRPELAWRHLRTHLDLTAGHLDADLIVWPEAALTFDLREARQLLSRLDRRLAERGATLVTGVPEWTDDGAGLRLRNAAVAFGAGGGLYEKRRLVPFGEYVPLERWLRGGIELFDLPMSRTSPGAWDQQPLRGADFSMAIAICYEIAYPRLVASQPGDVIVTISNDTWFGGSIGPHQHLEIARMRALELGRYVLRATNSGITALIGPDGAIEGRLPQFESGVLTGTFRVASGETPYARAGNWPLLTLWLLTAGCAGYGRARWRKVSS